MYNFEFTGKILIVTCPKNIELPIFKNLLRNTLNGFRYGMYLDSLGYYHGYDLKVEKFVYCNTLSKKIAIELMNKYIKEND